MTRHPCDQTLQRDAGAVEKWLLDSESCIKRTLHQVAGDSLAAYAKAERSKWILDWPGQIVLNCSQVRVRVGVCTVRASVSVASGSGGG